MDIGVPREVKDHEYRVAVTPAGVHEYMSHGHRVLVERGAGTASGFTDDEYEAAGGVLVERHEDVFARAEMVMKVKEPTPSEYGLLREDLILFAYLHLAANPPLARELLERRVIAVAYETVQLPDGRLPLLAPMSEVAGRLATQVGAYYLMKTNGGRGVVLGGVAGVLPAKVVVIGGGVVGTNAAVVALGMGAEVTVIDRDIDRLRELQGTMGGRFTTLASTRAAVADAVAGADLVIGSVLIPGARAPKIVTRDMVTTMPAGSVIVDVAIDQGGCVETARPTTHSDPVYVDLGVVHYGVTNMPGAVPRTSTFALSNVTLPYGLRLADNGIRQAVTRDRSLAGGVNTYRGAVTNEAVASALGVRPVALEDLL